MSIIFRLFNFALVVGLAVYAFKKYVLVTITQQIAEQQQQLDAMQQRAQDIKQQTYAVERATQAQEILSKNLQARLVVWMAKHTHAAQLREQEREARRLALHEKAAVQSHFLATRKLEHAALPGALDAAQRQLEQTYSGVQGQAYVASIISQLKQSESL